jgi:hypothetical protein
VEDIAEHFNTLRSLSAVCEVVVEFGVRNADATSSTMAFLAGQPKELHSYEITPLGDYDHVYTKAEELKTVWFFHPESSLEANIPFCDFLFIDTEHTPEQVEQEIKRHISKVGRYIGFHDTHCAAYPEFGPAVFELMKKYPEFHLYEDHRYNNGLTIYRRL